MILWNCVELLYMMVVWKVVASSQCYTRTHRQGWARRGTNYAGSARCWCFSLLSLLLRRFYYLCVFMRRGHLESEASKFFTLERIPKGPYKHTSYPQPHIHKVCTFHSGNLAGPKNSQSRVIWLLGSTQAGVYVCYSTPIYQEYEHTLKLDIYFFLVLKNTTWEFLGSYYIHVISSPTKLLLCPCHSLSQTHNLFFSCYCLYIFIN